MKLQVGDYVKVPDHDKNHQLPRNRIFKVILVYNYDVVAQQTLAVLELNTSNMSDRYYWDADRFEKVDPTSVSELEKVLFDLT